MKKFIYIFVISFFAFFQVFAQQKITVQLNRQPLVDLFKIIEQQTEYRIYCLPGEADSLLVSINETNIKPFVALQKALLNTDYRVSEYNNRFFILKGKELVTSLPEGFFRRTSEEGNAVIPVFEKQESKATSESVLYAIGNPDNPSATDVTLSGIVTDFNTGEPVIGMTLFIEDPPIGVTTDVFGFYSIRLPPGRQELNIRGTGIKDSKRQLMLYSDGKLDIEVDEKIYALTEVTILSEKTDNIRSATIGVERLQMKSIKNIPTAFGEADVVRIVMALPGVKSVGEVSSGFNVRGGATDQNLILYNDGTVYASTHLFGLFSVFNPDVVNEMELYKSSIPAKYGGRISSVLDINSREGNKKRVQGTASIGLLTSRLTLEGPLFAGKGSFIVGGRTTYSDWLMDKIPEKSGYRNGKAGFYDLNASANYRFDTNNSIYLNGYYSSDRFSFKQGEKYDYQNANFSLKWRHVFTPKFTSTYTVGYDHYSYNNENTEFFEKAYSLDFGIDQVFGKADFSYYIGKNTINAGISSIAYWLEPGNYQAIGESMVQNDRLQDEKALESAIYLSDQWEISPDLSVSAGIRYSLFNALGPREYNIYSPGEPPSLRTVIGTESAGKGILKTYHGPEFRLSARYTINENTSVKAGINTMRQYIHKMSNTVVMSPTDIWKLSDVNIRPQTGTQYVAGIFKNFANNLIESSVEVYYKTMKDYPDYRGGAELIMNHHLETEIRPAKGKAYGVEMMVKKTRGKLNGWVSYTYSRTLLRQNDSDDARWFPADFDKPHEIKFVGNFRLTQRHSFSLNCDYSTGRPITLPISKYIYDGAEYVYYADRNKYRIPDFFRIDISYNLEYGHHLTKFTHSYITIGVYNLTGRKNAYSVYYVSENNRIKGYKLSIFGVPIPYISYNIKFR